ncbi:MAG TPA: Clp protease N-terminal domain-containing protein [Paludibaculum sp.]|jgi:ATP-dependent Clp protease ATP-binding subunit ClpC
MFERYAEETRRAIFFALQEAIQAGCPFIETEHLLLGMLREDAELAERFRQAPGGIEAVRGRIEEVLPGGSEVRASAELPLSKACKRALRNASDTASAMGQMEIGIGHLVLGLLSEGNCLAAEILRERGLG